MQSIPFPLHPFPIAGNGGGSTLLRGGSGGERAPARTILEKEIARVDSQIAKTRGAIDREMLASIMDNFEKVMAEGPNPK